MSDAALIVLSDLDGTLLDHTTYAFDAARAALLEALRWDPTSVPAADLFDEVLAKELEARLAAERRRIRDQRLAATAAALAIATAAQGRGYPAVALKVALAAQRIAPDADGLAAEHPPHA